jgi:hypothetical protein
MIHLADEAVESMTALGKHGDKKSKEIAERAVVQNENYKRELAVIGETKKPEGVEGIKMGGSKSGV